MESEFNGLLTLLTFFPLVGVLILLLWRGVSDTQIKWTAIITSAVTLVISVVVLASFRAGDPGLQMVDRAAWIPSWGISYYMGIDGISILMVLLTTIISLLAIISSWSAIETQVKQYYIFMLLLQVGMMGVFLAQDMFLFYVFWEFTLIPMYFLIGIWGGGRRVYAAIKFFLYTMAGSLLMLLAILYMGLQTDPITFAIPDLVAQRATFAGVQNLLFIGFFVAFAIKVPIFPFHSWLPDAHTEAPTAGSVILAGILLKMGTYGLIRFNLPLFPQASADFAPYIAVLAIIGIIYGAIVAFAQQDVKKLVAYSSISHLGFVVLGIFSLTAAGVQGGILQGFNHGISSGALFFIVGILYEQRHTREMKEYGGIWKVMPVFSVLTLIIVLSSMGLPGLNGFVGEFTILLGSMGAATFAPAWIYTAFAVTGVILAAVYLLWMFQRVFLGPVTVEANNKLRDINTRDLFVMCVFLLFVFWVGIAPSGFFNLMDTSVTTLLADMNVPELAQRVATFALLGQ
ncbi:MAG: NADH-quinone oxidoreductase subunit M [Chloroflexi bacterium]|nr:NADH-quinone oxidoreductase subunit M [Ardenticatenaceae bacterium]MBL1127009.1 NADH-quinone oxidoreductase subunit M [Chloroflexota bacterium]NOG33068.1 NADH-quinone oxidoreductase subunit M [Chloroflexota bacterium]GIK54633.1 MAG: NADH:ubiquinone oxidoreductase subunit M [Chloroflexota bacterium]